MQRRHLKKEPEGRNKAAFTLVEMIAAVGIILVLALMLFPAVGKWRVNAERTQCSQNLRQLGATVTLYTQDSDGTYPSTAGLLLGKGGGPPFGLIDRLSSYLESEGDWKIFYCPDAEHSVPAPSLTDDITYAYQLTQSGKERFLRIGYYWLVSSSPQWRSGLLDSPVKITGGALRVLAMCPHFGGAITHDRRYNVLFADGHVETRKSDANGMLLNHVNQTDTNDGQEALMFDK
jgi:prepilin-type processing-associated H-X9-DG protein